MTTNKSLSLELDISTYLIDIRGTVIPNVSSSSPAPAWMSASKVLLPLEQTIHLVIAEHLEMATELRRAIQVAYVQGLWPNYLNADKLRLRQLNSLSKLTQQANFPILQAAHHQFLDAAAEAATFAQAGNIEAAYEMLTSKYDKASLQLVTLLKNIVPCVRVTRERLEKSLALA